ncbi:hypothetical protein [Lentzea sp.]|uniref:ComF family protein n=1 Tax=Lentzea sp. TaxID=56099 RepID=UPI002ED5ADE9
MSPFSRILDSYRNVLVTPSARGENVCVTCRRPTEGYERCWQCQQHFAAHGSELADEVVPISFAEKDRQLAHTLFQYKNNRSDDVKRQLTNELACVLAAFLAGHERCWGDFDLVTTVPSSRSRTSPLVDVLGRRIGQTRTRFTSALITRCGNDRKMRPDCYEVSTGGRGVLLVDDTWTSGASLQSSAVALKRAGATRVVGLVIGRHLDKPAPATVPFDWDACVLCAQRDR